MATEALAAFDFASFTGWAVWIPPSTRESGTWQIAPREGEGSGLRYIRLRGHLDDLLRRTPGLAHVAYEQAHHRAGPATRYAYGCIAELEKWCAENNLTHEAIHSATLKKWATGNGRAKKHEMVQAARERLGVDTFSHDEADALWLLDRLRFLREGRRASPCAFCWTALIPKHADCEELLEGPRQLRRAGR